MVGVIRASRGEVQRAPDEPAHESHGADTEASQPEHSPGIPGKIWMDTVATSHLSSQHERGGGMDPGTSWLAG